MKQYGSKKKKRREEYLQRETKRKMERERLANYNKVMREGDIEQMAAVMGIKLR